MSNGQIARRIMWLLLKGKIDLAEAKAMHLRLCK